MKNESLLQFKEFRSLLVGAEIQSIRFQYKDMGKNIDYTINDDIKEIIKLLVVPALENKINQ